MLRVPHQSYKEEQVSEGKKDLRSSWEAGSIREDSSKEVALEDVRTSSCSGREPWTLAGEDMRREDALLNLKDMRLERQMDENWEKLDTDWPELISIWWNGAGEVALWQILFSQSGHSNSSDSIRSSRLKQKVESNFLPSQRVVL